MEYPAYIREKARSLRREKQLTIDELADRLALSRSTIYYWVRDMPIPESGSGGGWPTDAQRKGKTAVERKYRLLRDQAYEQGVREFDLLAADPTFRDFVCMYIGEGYKRNRNVVSIANSAPAVAQLSIRWMRCLTSRPVSCAVQYHADQDPESLRQFWGSTLDVDPASIRLQRKSNTGQLASRTWRSKYGVISVTSNDTYFRARLQAWIDRLSKSWMDAGTLANRGA